jgi:hypothetical protein
MRSIIPDAKLVYLVRDPIDRIYSSYRYRRFSLHQSVSELNDVLRDYENAIAVKQSQYAYQLDRYLPSFALSQLLVVDQADLANDRQTTLRRIFAHLGVDSEFTTPAFAVRHNQSADLHANRAGRAVLGTLRQGLGGHRTAIIRRRTPRWLIRPLLKQQNVEEVSVDPALLDEVRAYLREDTERLRTLTGLRFETWSV